MQPQDLAAVVAVARSGRAWLPVGAGRDGGLRPERPVTLVATRSLPVRISIDERSGIARLTANARWSDVAERAEEHGWSIDHLADVDRAATVGGTLGRATLLPGLWLAGTARGACIGLEAIGCDGQLYGYKEAPRTSSGPDFRAAWIGAEGRAGLMTRAAIELSRPMDAACWSVAIDDAPIREQRAWLDAFAGRATVVGGDERSLQWRVRGAGRVVDVANERIGRRGAAIGSAAVMQDAPPDGPRALASIPWSAWQAAWSEKRSAQLSVRVVAAGPTHVVLCATHPTSPAVAERWARRVADRPLARWAVRGTVTAASADGWSPASLTLGRSVAS